MTYWRAYEIGDKLHIYAVGVVVSGSPGLLIPPSDGRPYMNHEQMLELKRTWKPKPKIRFPWERRNTA